MQRNQLLKIFKDHYMSNLPHGSSETSAPDKSAMTSLFEHTLRTQAKSPNLKTYTQGRQTYIDLSCANMPFTVASLLNLLSARGIHVYSQQNFMMDVTFSSSKLLAFNGDNRIIVLRLAVEFLSDEERRELEKQILNLCGQVGKVTGDWQAIIGQVEQSIQDYTDNQTSKIDIQNERKLKFIDWLSNNKCLFLGYGKYTSPAVGGKAAGGASKVLTAKPLGLNKSTNKGMENLDKVMASIPAQEGIDFFKLPVMSPVHRRVYIHCISIGIKTSGKSPKIEEHRFLLLYSFDFFSCALSEIPYIREGFQRQLDRLKIQPNTYKWRLLRYALASYPRDEILQIIEDKAFNSLTERMMSAFSSTSFRNMVYYDKRKLFINNIILAPREDYNTDVRRGFEKVIKNEMNVDDGEFNVLFSEERLARVFLSFPLSDDSPLNANTKQLEEDIAEVGVSWKHELRLALLEKFGDQEGIALYKNYADIFGTSYRERFSGEQAAEDVKKIIAIGSGEQQVDINLLPKKIGGYYKLRLIGARSSASLSHLVHILEHAGAEPITSRPYFFYPCGDLDGKGGINQEIRLIEFNLRIKGKAKGNTKDGNITTEPDAKYFKRALEETLSAVYCGVAEDDEFNGLAISIAMSSSDIMLLRAWANYLAQVQTAFPRAYIKDTLCTYPHCAELLVTMFKQKFATGNSTGKGKKPERLLVQLDALLEDVPSLEQEQILRNISELIGSIVRSNFHQLDAPNLNEMGAQEDAKYVTFKIQPNKLSFTDGKQPRTEIFVYSSDFEGVHLRDGPLARGGIRWSDKRAGYRNEVYQLVKAQIVKNAIIVPTGAKGGFYIKNTTKNIRQIYSVFIGALLDLTDNYIGGKLVKPKGGNIYDAPDPYLVVAPDKGTADLSDLANEISARRNFWMTDAFASSGSSGYSHKDMGITARGAWEAVRRSFAELGIDANKDPIEVMGVGDMSGDVFGNGMLLSRNMKLICAFNHLNIFIDPSPNPQKSFAERQRLFRKSRSTWQDFSKSAMSPNGAIFSRSAKSIKLNPAIQEKFGIKDSSISPDNLIKHILQSPADLLWFGGIGTYVKGTKETSADVKDLPNDKIRVNGSELQVKVIGEGANLGATLQGRIEFDRSGGRVATDSNDNSGGVHCSDKEVNIKIMLSVLQDKGKLSSSAREKLLRAMTDDVSEGVLTENIAQNLALSMEKNNAVELFNRHKRLTLTLDAASDMGLSMEENSDSLTRPQLANLFGALKNKLKEELEHNALTHDEHTLKLLRDYFPPQLSKLAGASIRQHFLSEQIVNIQAINRIVDHLGLAFWSDLIEDGLEYLPELVSVFLRLDEIFSFTKVLESLSAHPSHYPQRLPEILQIRSIFIGMLKQLMDGSMGGMPHKHKLKVLQVLADYLAKSAKTKTTAKITNAAHLLKSQVDALMSGDKFLLAAMLSMHSSLKIVSDGENLIMELIEGLDKTLSLDELIGGNIADVEYWQRKGREAIREDILLQRQRILEKLLATSIKAKSVKDALDKWHADNELTIASYKSCIKEFSASQEIGSMAYLASILRKL